MGGKRLGSFREGDCSEYLAQYILSRFSFVNPSPRQEDFGVTDFLCVLAKNEDKMVFPENTFYVQVKSGVQYIEYDEEATKWISSHMDAPLVILNIDKKKLSFKIYSCWNIWTGLFKKHLPKKITLVLDTNLPLTQSEVNKKTNEIKVPLGTPILNMTIEEIESNPTICYDVLKKWLELDKKNIARRSIGRIFVSGWIDWLENKIPNNTNILQNYYFYGSGYNFAEFEVAPILTALAHNYQHNNQDEKFKSIVQILLQLKSYLNDEEIKFLGIDNNCNLKL